MKLKTIAVFLLLTTATIAGSAQNIDKAIGLRMSPLPGITFQMFQSKSTAIELLFQRAYGGYQVTGLYELHNPAFDVPHLYWYVGGGAHVGTYFWGNSARWNRDYDGPGQFVLGVDGILGLEYQFMDVPFMISVDWKPGFNLIGPGTFLHDDGAVSLRYTF